MAGIPVAYNLGALYQYVTGQPPTVSHPALADVKDTISVLFHQIFWENRSKFVFSFGRPEEEVVAVAVADAVAVVPAAQQQPSLLDDSDTSVSSQDSSATTADSNTGETTDNEDDVGPAGDKWEEDSSQYRSLCPLPSQLFEEHFTSSGCSRRQQTGLQCNPIDVNTPIRAWREVFKNALLDKIVRYTNNYGQVKSKRW
jgi:hypothetical protein